MSAAGCSSICQHPGCWKSEINQLRRHNTNGAVSRSSIRSRNLYHQFDAKDLRICENEDSLPSYKILNLFQNELEDFPDHILFQSTEAFSKQDDPQWSSFQNYQSNQISVHSVIHPGSERRWQHEKGPISKQEEVKLKTIELDDQVTADEFERVYTWVPGEKSRKSLYHREKYVNKGINVKVIDGEFLPDSFIHKNKRTERKHLCSATGGQPYPMRATSRQLPPLITDDIINEIDIFQFFGLSINEYMTADSRLSDFTHVSSPLRTKRMSIQPHLLSRIRSSKVIDNQKQLNVKYADKVGADEVPIQVGSVAPNCESAKGKPTSIADFSSSSAASHRNHRGKERSRSVLRLTRVSVPKKSLQRYPVFDHCFSSIKNSKLSEVEMKPLSSSENVSTASSKASMEPKITVGGRNTVFIENPKAIERPNHEISTPKNTPEFSNSTSNRLLHSTDKKTVKASTNDAIPFDLHVIDKIYKNNVASSLTLKLNKGASEDFSSDEDLIRQTHERYLSLSSFKRRTGHAFSIDQVDGTIACQSRSARPSGKQCLPTSIHTLDCRIPEDLQSKKKVSMIKRSISPSKSFQIRQQRQLPQEIVPTGIKVSQMQILPSRDKSPLSDIPIALKMSCRKENDSAVPHNIISETPPSSPVERLAKYPPVKECSTNEKLVKPSHEDIAEENALDVGMIEDSPMKSTSDGEIKTTTSFDVIRLSKALSEPILNEVSMETNSRLLAPTEVGGAEPPPSEKI